MIALPSDQRATLARSNPIHRRMFSRISGGAAARGSIEPILQDVADNVAPRGAAPVRRDTLAEKFSALARADLEKVDGMESEAVLLRQAREARSALAFEAPRLLEAYKAAALNTDSANETIKRLRQAIDAGRSNWRERELLRHKSAERTRGRAFLSRLARDPESARLFVAEWTRQDFMAGKRTLILHRLRVEADAERDRRSDALKRETSALGTKTARLEAFPQEAAAYRSAMEARSNARASIQRIESRRADLKRRLDETTADSILAVFDMFSREAVVLRRGVNGCDEDLRSARADLAVAEAKIARLASGTSAAAIAIAEVEQQTRSVESAQQSVTEFEPHHKRNSAFDVHYRRVDRLELAARSAHFHRALCEIATSRPELAEHYRALAVQAERAEEASMIAHNDHELALIRWGGADPGMFTWLASWVSREAGPLLEARRARRAAYALYDAAEAAIAAFALRPPTPAHFPYDDLR